MSTHYNNVAQGVSGTPGTGTITLGSAVTGAQTLGAAAGGNATVDVFITDGNAWEVARNCTYTHSGTTLTRGTLEASSTGSVLSLTNSAIVRVAMPASSGNDLIRVMQMVTPGGRLTTESGAPVSTSDRTAQSTLYYTPFVHDGIVLWDGTDWRPITFTERSIALSGLVSGRPYDVFGYLSGGALALELTAWTNDTTRATAVALQDGRYCRSGDKTRLLLGTIYTTNTNATEDSNQNRYVCNVYNRVTVGSMSPAGTNHTYNSGTAREWNNGSGTLPRINFVCALPAQINASAQAFCGSIGSSFNPNPIIFISLNGSSTPTGEIGEMFFAATSQTSCNLTANGAAGVAAGRHYITIFQQDYSNGACSFRAGRTMLKGYQA